MSALDVQMLWSRWQDLLRVRAVGKEFVASKMLMRSSAGRDDSALVECGEPVAMLGLWEAYFFCGCSLTMLDGLVCGGGKWTRDLFCAVSVSVMNQHRFSQVK